MSSPKAKIPPRSNASSSSIVLSWTLTPSAFLKMSYSNVQYRPTRKTAIRIEISFRLVRYLIIKLLMRVMSIDCSPQSSVLGGNAEDLVKCCAEIERQHTTYVQGPIGVTQITPESPVHTSIIQT